MNCGANAFNLCYPPAIYIVPVLQCYYIAVVQYAGVGQYFKQQQASEKSCI